MWNPVVWHGGMSVPPREGGWGSFAKYLSKKKCHFAIALFLHYFPNLKQLFCEIFAKYCNEFQIVAKYCICFVKFRKLLQNNTTCLWYLWNNAIGRDLQNNTNCFAKLYKYLQNNAICLQIFKYLQNNAIVLIWEIMQIFFFILTRIGHS